MLARLRNYFRRVWYSKTSGKMEGSIRAGGGAFAKKEQAQEDLYFRKLDQERIENLAHNTQTSSAAVAVGDNSLTQDSSKTMDKASSESKDEGYVDVIDKKKSSSTQTECL